MTTTMRTGHAGPEGETMPDPAAAPAGLPGAGTPAAPEAASWASQVLHYLRANPGLLAPTAGAGRP